MIVLIVVIFFTFTEGVHEFPPGIQFCHRTDPNFQKCAAKGVGDGLSRFAKGSRYFGIPTLDPFFIKEMVLKSEASQTVAVEQTYQNIRMHGMTNSNTEQNFKIDLVENCAWTMDVKTPVLILEGDYKISGTLLMFPLNGFGKCNITMYNMVNTHKSTCEKYAVKGKTYLKLTNYTMDIKLDKITMDFENIFPGNAQISAEILKTLNDNSDAVFKDIKSGFEQVFSSIHLTMANKVFSKVPLNEIFLD